MPATRSAMDIVARRFNDSFTYRWERVIDFLKLHYVLTQRTDSDFWRDNCRAESIPERLSELLTLWRHQPPSRYDFYRVEEVFPSASYQYVLYGMGFRPERSEAIAAHGGCRSRRRILPRSRRADRQDAGGFAYQSRIDRTHQTARAATNLGAIRTCDGKAGTRQPAKVTPFAGDNEATVRKRAAGRFFQ